MIRCVKIADAQALADIYNHYIKNTAITFEEETVQVSNMVQRIEKVINVNLPWLVIMHNDVMLGYAYATPWKARSA